MEPFEIERLDKNGHALSAPPGKHEMYFDTCVQDCRAMPEACRGVPTSKADDPQIDACASALHASRADVSNCLAAKGELGIANCLALWAKAKR